MMADTPWRFDGGTLRVWADDGRERKVASWLEDKLGEYLDPARRVCFGDELDRYLSSRHSGHVNWGSVVCFADKDVALCKSNWIEDPHTGRRSLLPRHHQKERRPTMSGEVQWFYLVQTLRPQMEFSRE